MDKPDVIDEAAMQRLLRIGGKDLVAELIAIFLKNTPVRIQAAMAAATSGRMEQVLVAAHSLKSSCANIGANRMNQIAAEIEKHAQNNANGNIAAMLRELDDAFQKVRVALEQRGMEAQHHQRIAVVEDNADNRLLVRAILEGLYDISEYENGAEALADMRIHRPDLVLLDISLPGMDGYAVLAALRAAPDMAKLPVIALTAHAMTGDRSKMLAAGFDDYIAKPIDDENNLLASIDRLLKR